MSHSLYRTQVRMSVFFRWEGPMLSLCKIFEVDDHIYRRDMRIISGSLASMQNTWRLSLSSCTVYVCMHVHCRWLGCLLAASDVMVSAQNRVMPFTSVCEQKLTSVSSGCRPYRWLVFLLLSALCFCVLSFASVSFFVSAASPAVQWRPFFSRKAPKRPLRTWPAHSRWLGRKGRRQNIWFRDVW